MKKIHLFFASAMLLVTGTVFSQTIPNAGFENWSTTYTTPQPHGWNTTNSYSQLISASPLIQQSTDARSGKYSARISAKAIGKSTFPGVLYQGDIQTSKGIQYTSQAKKLSFSYKANIAAGDSAQIFLAFYNNTDPILIVTGGLLAEGGATIKGKHSSWVDTSVTINYAISSDKPEKMVFAILYANPQKNTFIQIDSIILSGSGTVAQMPNNNFEKWDSTGVDQADGWFSLNKFLAISGNSQNVFKSTDANSGSYALKMVTDTFNLGGRDTFSLITTGSFGTNGIQGGFPSGSTTTRPDKFSFYYKYTPGSAGDSANAAVWIRKNGKSIDSAIAHLPAAAAYTLYELNIPGKNAGDTINIAFSSSNVEGKHGAAIGSTLLVDDLSFSVITGIDEITNTGDYKLFPNPAKGNIYLQYSKQDAGQVDVVLFNSLGQEMIHKKVPVGANDHNSYMIETSGLPSGLYFYSLQSGKEFKNGKLVIE